MKTTTPALVTYLNSFRPENDATLNIAELFTIVLASGSTLRYTNHSWPISWMGNIFSCTGLQIDGLRYKASLGLSVDRQQVTIAARGDDLYGGFPFLQALQQGLFDMAHLTRERAFYVRPDASSPFPPVIFPIGTVVLFKGRVAEVSNIGRAQATVEVASDTVLLDIDMPRNLFKTDCCNVFCDSGCGLSRSSYSASGNVLSGSTQTTILWSAASSLYQQGSVTFSSGPNAGATATVKSASPGHLVLAYPLPHPPQVGDSFTALQGCDHTMATCRDRFSNLGHFRGFPYVPPPQIITGPMATTYTTGGK